MSLVLSLILAGSASAASKQYLATDPMLAGSIIKYCEHGSSTKSCKTIDRRNEAIVHDIAAMSGQLTLRLSEVASEFHTVNVDFAKSDKVPNSINMQFKFSQDPAKKPAKP